jgi:glycine betaine/choline ABC-type transport system substrate-binding protein
LRERERARERERERERESLEQIVDTSSVALLVCAYINKEIEPGTSAEETYKNAKEGFKDKYSLIVLKSMGFNNTYANAIRTDYAEANGIKSNSDLVPFSKDLVYGAEHSFYDRLDGFFKMCDMYGLEFKRYTKIDVGLKQQSIKQKEIDVAAVYSTDGWLEGSGLTVLEDDMRFFPSYYCCPVVRQDALDKYPEIEAILAPIENCCTEADIIYFNNLVDTGKMSISDAASQFIKDKKLLG